MLADLADLGLRLLAATVAFLLPGWLAAGSLGPRWTGGMRVALGATLGLLVVPLACFASAWVLGTNVRPPLVVGTGVVLAAIVALARVATGWRPWGGTRGDG